MVASLLCFTVSIVAIINYMGGSKEIEDLRSEVMVDENSSSGSAYVETPVNFEELKKQNPDIYAWINIPGTVVDYPVLRHEDNNAYYLEHSVSGKYSAAGSIYTEYYNDLDFADFNTIVYGHNMKNGTMFAALKKFRNKAFFDENRYINIYMPGRILKYEIFAAHVTNDKHILFSYDFSSESVRSQYIDEIFSKTKNANINKELEVTKDDNIITLSTCTNVKTERYLVQGVLVYDSRKQ